LLAAIGRAVTAGIVIVISAGNDGDKPEGVNADPFALTAAQTYPGAVIIAGSVGVPVNGDPANGTDVNTISSFSNRAGMGAPWYLMALGYRDRAPSTDGQTYFWSGTSFSAPTISGAAALLAQAFPTLSGQQIIDILLKSADDLGSAGTDSTYGRGRLNIDSAFKPMGTTTVAGTAVAAGTADNGDLPPASGDAGTQGSLGVVILDGYSRAFALDMAKTLRQAAQAKPLHRALQGDVKVAGAAAGPVTVAMTVTQRRDRPFGYQLDRLGIGPEDARQSRLVAGSAIARLDRNTAAAFGFAEGAKALERRLNGAEAGAFLIAKDVAGDPGFATSRGSSMALRRDLGPLGVTMSSESGHVWQEVKTSATGSPYKLATVTIDRNFGKTWLSAGISRLDEKQSLLGGRLGQALGGGGSSSLFLDVEARRSFGPDWSAGATVRRGWTDFAGGRLQSAAYGVDLAKLRVFDSSDRAGLRLSQPLRVERGGVRMFLPTAYDYATLSATNSLSRFSLSPSGREVDAELSYSRSLFGGDGWLGGNLFVRRQPGHIASADNDYGAAVRFTLGF
jgi:hypothetical protein